MKMKTAAGRGHWLRPATAMLLAATAGCGANAGLMISTSGENIDPCVPLAEETIAIGQQLLDVSDATGNVDESLACRFLANEIALVDMGCITESELPDGVDRNTLVLQQQDFSCDSSPDGAATP